MTVQLLPSDFDSLVTQAVQTFWASRSAGSAARSQGGARDAVIGGTLGAHSSLSDATNIRAMFNEFSGKVLAALS